MLRKAFISLILVLPLAVMGQANMLGIWSFSGISDTESRQPGSGVAYRYSSADIRADIFYFSAGHDWQEGTSDPLFDRMVKQALVELKVVEAAGVFRNLQFVDVTDVIVANVHFKLIKMRFDLRGIPSSSLFYITGFNHKLLKFRLTAPDEQAEFLNREVNGFIGAALVAQPDIDFPWLKRS